MHRVLPIANAVFDEGRTVTMEATRYYLVKTKCGHVRRGNYIPITFPVEAVSAKKAAAIARQKPRVKHNHLDAILDVKEVSYDEFRVQEERNMFDPYLRIHSRKEHREMLPMFAFRIVPETKKPRKRNGYVSRLAMKKHCKREGKVSMPETEKRQIRKNHYSRKEIYYKGDRIRHPKRFIRCYRELVG